MDWELLVLELLKVAVVVLLAEAVVEDKVWVTMLGSVEGMGFPSLVWSFTTWRPECRAERAVLVSHPTDQLLHIYKQLNPIRTFWCFAPRI